MLLTLGRSPMLFYGGLNSTFGSHDISTLHKCPHELIMHGVVFLCSSR